MRTGNRTLNTLQLQQRPLVLGFCLGGETGAAERHKLEACRMEEQQPHLVAFQDITSEGREHRLAQSYEAAWDVCISHCSAWVGILAPCPIPTNVYPGKQ